MSTTVFGGLSTTVHLPAMGIGKQLKARRLALGLTLEKLEEMTGVGAGTINALENRDSERSAHFPALAKALGLSLESLYAGGAEPPEPIDTTTHPDLVSVPTMAPTLRAGATGFTIENQQAGGPRVILQADWLRDRGCKPHHLAALQIQGASMAPTMYPGDLVVVNAADTEPRDGKTYAVNYEGEAVVRRIHRDGGAWWLSSDNPDQRRFPRKEHVEGSCIILGRVILRQSEEI